MIDPNIVTTIRVGELPSEPFNLTDSLPHEIGTVLKRGTVQQLVDLISSVISVDSSVGFRAVSVTDGQTLPTTTEQEFILVGKGTYYNVAGGDTIVLTEELNALVSNGSFWFIGVEIPINVELAGITQFIRSGFTTTAPSEDTVFNALQNIDLSAKEDISNKQNGLSVDGTNLKYPTVTAVNAGLSTKLDLTGGTLTGNLNGTNLILSGDITVKPTGNFFIGDAIGQTGIIINATNNNLTEAIRFFVNNNDAIFANYLGNVGVGTITPTEKLQVIGKATVSVAPTNPTDVVRKTELDLKANLASPALTGTPTAPTATAGTNTTQIATTAFVTSADSGNVKLTGNQSITGNKSFSTSDGNSTLSVIKSGAVGSSAIIQSGSSSTGGTLLEINTTTGNANTNTAKLLVLNSGSLSVGLPLSVQNSGANTFTVDKFGVTTLVGGTALNNAVPRSQLLYTNQTVTANKTVAISEFVNNNHLILRVDTTAGNVTITLPTFTALQGYKVTVRKIDSSANSISITGVAGVNIDGAATLVVSGQYGKSTVGADLVQYIIL